MKNKFLSSMAVAGMLASANTFGQAIHQNDCNPTAKFFCACENMTHGAYYQISYMKLDLTTGERSIITALKLYYMQPVFQRHEGSPADGLKDCRILMNTYPECQ